VSGWKGKRVEEQSRVVEPLVVCFGYAGTTNVARSMNINIAFFVRATLHSPSFFVQFHFYFLHSMRCKMFIPFTTSLFGRVFSTSQPPGHLRTGPAPTLLLRQIAVVKDATSGKK